MSQEPADISRHLDAAAFTSAGGLILSASSLTNRSWTGSLWYFNKPDVAPDVEQVTSGSVADSGISHLTIISEDRIITASDSGAVSLWELEEPNKSILCKALSVGHDDVVTSVSVMADNSKIISSSQDYSILVWDLEIFVPSRTFRAHHDIVKCVSCHPDNSNLFISAGQDGRLLLWDLRQSKPATCLDTTSLLSNPTWVAWQPAREHQAVVGTETGNLVTEDIRSQTVSPTNVCVHSRSITRLKFAQHNKTWLASCSEDCRVAVTDVDAGRVIYRDDIHEDFVTGIDWAPNNNLLYSCGWDFKVKSREVTEMENLSSPLATMAIHEKHKMPTSTAEPMDDTPQWNGFTATSQTNGCVLNAQS